MWGRSKRIVISKIFKSLIFTSPCCCYSSSIYLLAVPFLGFRQFRGFRLIKQKLLPYNSNNHVITTNHVNIYGKKKNSYGIVCSSFLLCEQCHRYPWSGITAHLSIWLSCIANKQWLYANAVTKFTVTVWNWNVVKGVLS